MKKIYFIIALLAICFIISFNVVAQQNTNVKDSLALVDLYNSTDGAHWTNNTNWLTNKRVATWYGVTAALGLESGIKRVTEINLTNNNLNGVLPKSIGTIFYLQSLGLRSNHISGSIPVTIDSLKNLEILDLSYDSLTGTLPTYLNDLKKLFSLALNNNSFTGKIPSNFDGLTGLNFLYLQNNQLNDTIPKELANLPYLQFLELNNNQLKGNIPVEFGNFASLISLYLNNNQLTGSIPKQLGKLEKLAALILSNNQLSGSIPKEIIKSKSFVYLFFDHNHLNGNIPNVFANGSKLEQIYLNQNNLSGVIPRSMGNLTKLAFLSLAHNDFTSIIPDTLKNCIKLIKLQLSDNELRGALPSFLKALPYLDTINIEHNHFTFAGLEPLVQHNFGGFYYDNQRKITIHQTANTLYVSAGSTLSNNPYKWYKDGSLVGTITGDSTYTPTASGVYYVQVTNSICTELILQSGDYAFTLSVMKQENVTSMQTNTKSNFSIYPNPAHDFINAYFSNAIANATINVYNVNGTKVIEKLIDKQEPNILSLNIVGLIPGVYFIEIKYDKYIYREQFMKN